MTFDETLHNTFESLGERLGAELQLAATQLTGALQQDRERRMADAAAAAIAVPPAPTSPVVDRLPAAVRSIGAARSLSEILDILSDCAAHEAPRAALLVARAGRFRGWRFTGFASLVEAPGAIEIAEADAGLLTAALHAGAPVSGESSGPCAAPAFAALPPDRASMALPIAIGGQVVAVLYVDQGADNGQEIGDALNVGQLEVLTSYAARCLEVQSAFKVARALIARLDTPEQAAAPPAAAAAPTDADASSDDHAAARRYAQLLVSEIKLYHELAVAAGRRERDLATRLGDEIARARSLFEQRVPAPQRRDYFHAELVRTLAGGDASLIARHSSSV